MTGRVLAVLVVLVGAAGCSGGANPAEVIPARGGSLEDYSASVQPILEARCATIDCHGDPGRPLRLYAETGLRARDDLRNQPITSEELAANAAAMIAVDPGVPVEESLVMTKPLGLVGHVGGMLWAAGEPQPQCVLGWLSGKSTDAAVAAACAAAAPQVALPPP